VSGVALVKFIVFILLIALPQISLAQELVRYVYSKDFPDSKGKYFVDLLTLALEKTKTEFGDYTLQPVAIEMAQERTSRMLEHNKYIDLTWRMTSKNLEKNLQAIYFPLLKGLMGYRIFIIRHDSQSQFPKKITLHELQKKSAGQGYNWPDGRILENNGFTLMQGYDIYLLKMLAKQRFDYFPRALHEPWSEIDGNEDFIVEKNILLKYNAPIFFFVNKENKRLAQRLELGLSRLLASGEFEQFFTHHSLLAGVVEKANLAHRKVFELHNPLISEKTNHLINDKRLWINLLE
jgi:hypothetical protein